MFRFYDPFIVNLRRSKSKHVVPKKYLVIDRQLWGENSTRDLYNSYVVSGSLPPNLAQKNN